MLNDVKPVAISLRTATQQLSYLQIFRSMDPCSSRPGPEGNAPDHTTGTRGVHFNVHTGTVLISWT